MKDLAWVDRIRRRWVRGSRDKTSFAGLAAIVPAAAVEATAVEAAAAVEATAVAEEAVAEAAV